MPIKITEEKSSIASSGENHFSSFKGLSLEAQLEQCRTTFGWSPTFSNEAIQFVNQTVGKLNLKQKKIPFGDLTTGLGLQKLSALQLLVDVQGIYNILLLMLLLEYLTGIIVNCFIICHFRTA